MLQVIDRIDDWTREIIKDDPVRKEIPIEFRINEDAEMFALWNNTELVSVCCVYYTDGIPTNVDEMLELASPLMDTVVFYTIWSYSKGSAGRLINEAAENIKKRYPKIKNIVTLSPKTEMAERFHIKNGAWKYRENPLTINYAYALNEDRITK